MSFAAVPGPCPTAGRSDTARGWDAAPRTEMGAAGPSRGAGRAGDAADVKGPGRSTRSPCHGAAPGAGGGAPAPGLGGSPGTLPHLSCGVGSTGVVSPRTLRPARLVPGERGEHHTDVRGPCRTRGPEDPIAGTRGPRGGRSTGLPTTPSRQPDRTGAPTAEGPVTQTSAPPRAGHEGGTWARDTKVHGRRRTTRLTCALLTRPGGLPNCLPGEGPRFADILP